MANTTLSPRQLQLLKQIRGSLSSSCCSPTIAELASNLKISRSTAYGHIEELQKKNLLSMCARKARSLTLTEKAHKLLESMESRSEFEREKGIPLVGRVAAGIPIEAIEDDRWLSLNSIYPSSENIFALEVAGDSMVEESIFDGDFVICKKTPVAKNGDLVVAIVEENNATLKRFYKEKQAVRLQPANKNYSPIYSTNVRIEGIVVGVLRKMN